MREQRSMTNKNVIPEAKKTTSATRNLYPINVPISPNTSRIIPINQGLSAIN